MDDRLVIVTDYAGREIRLTAERREHILEHQEMDGQLERILETIQAPESVIASTADDTVQVYQRYYESTPVTSKFLLVAVKTLEGDAFVLTAFFSRREKRGIPIWIA